MEIKLTEKPKKPIIIEGFPGLGLIGTISTEFLIKHLKAKSIGYIWSEELLPVAAIHEERVIQPLEIFYDKKNNLVIVHALSDIRGLEWKISDALVKLYKELDAQEIISLEGIMSKAETHNAYFYTNNPKKRKVFEKMRISGLKEGIIMGVTAAILLKRRNIITSGIFVESHSKLPDSKSAAKIIEVLDKYLSLNVDFKPLLKAAAQFEEKLKTLLEEAKKAKGLKKIKHPAYFG